MLSLKSKFLLLLPISVSTASLTHGAGFSLQERSSAGLGRAFSGEAAIAEDATVVASNPANMLLLEGTHYSLGITHYFPDVKVSGNLHVGPAQFFTEEDTAAPQATLPYAAITRRLNERFAIGFGFHSRYGLSTDYSDDFLGSYFAMESVIKTYDLSSKIAYKASDKLLLGAGLDFVYAEGKLTNSTPTNFTTPGLPSGASLAHITGDEFSYSYQLGATYLLSDSTRIGLVYQSTLDLEVTGNAETDVIPSLIGGRDTLLEATLPNSLEISIYHEINEQWAIHSSGTWTGWSSFDQIAIETTSAPQTTIAELDENWKDAYRISIGTTYKHNDKWTFRAGTAFDESPVKSANHRFLRTPDTDRYWLSLGATYSVNENYSIDLGYTHIFSKAARITDSSENLPGLSFEGTVKGSVDLVSISFNGSF